MFRLSIAGGACALLLSASPVAAEPFRHFLEMCLRADANAQVARDAALAAGWMKMPAADFAEENAPFEGLEVYFTESSPDESKAAFELLMTGWQSGDELMEIEGVRLDVCAVGFTATGYEPMLEAMETHMGFASAEVDGKPMWMFSREGNSLRPEGDILNAGLEERREAIQTRKLLMAGVWTEGDMTLLVLGASRPTR